MAKNGEFIIDINYDELKTKLGKAADSTIAEIESAVKGIADAAYANIVSIAQSKLKKTRLDYLKGLKFATVRKNQYVISLDGVFPNSIEDGWSPYSMKEKLLGSTKTVQAGSRAGQPWVQKGKKGQRYAHVPFEQQPFSKVGNAGDLGALIKKLTTVNKKGKEQKFTSIFKDEFNKPIQGKAASIRGTGIKYAENITKYQKTYVNQKTGKQTTSSVYLTFKTISDLSPAEAWMNKGFAGLHAFDKTEKYVEEQINIILNSLMK